MSGQRMNSAVRVNTWILSRSASGVSTRCSATMRPWPPAMTRMRSARRMASIRSWVIISTAQWRLSALGEQAVQPAFRPMSRAEKVFVEQQQVGLPASAGQAARLLHAAGQGDRAFVEIVLGQPHAQGQRRGRGVAGGGWIGRPP